MECSVCGMVMTKPKDFANGNPLSKYCDYCTSNNEISSGTVRESIIKFWASRYESIATSPESEAISA